MDKAKIIDNISKKSKVPVAELEKEYETIFNSLPPSDDREKQALKQLNNSHVGGGEDKTEDVEMVVIGLRQLTDFNKKTIADALEAYNKDKVSVLESGKVKLIDDVPKVIDMQESFTYNNETFKNHNFGKPLEAKYNRDTLVLARKPGDKTFVISHMELREQHAVEFDNKNMFIPLTVNCLGTIADGLKTGRSTKYLPFEEEINVNQLIAELAGDHIQELGDVFDYANGLDKKDYQRFVVTSGTLQYLNAPKTEGMSYNGSIDDITSDKLETVFIDPIVGVPEAKKDYTFICQTAIKEKKDKDKKPTGEMQVILNVMGWYP